MHSASLKRGRLTARLGRLEALPGGSEELKKQIGDKEQQLAKLCAAYEQLLQESKDTKKRIHETTKNCNEAEAEAAQLEQKKKEIEQNTDDVGIPSALKQLKKKKEEAETESQELISRTEKGQETLQRLLEKRRRDMQEKTARASQLNSLETEEKELIEASESDQKEAKELEIFITRLAKTLFERQRKLEEMLIQGNASVGGVEKRLREERRRLLREKQLLEERFPSRPEIDEEETQKSDFGLRKIEEDLQTMVKTWAEDMDMVQKSDILLAQEEAFNSALNTRISQVDAAIQLLQIKKESPMYLTYMNKLKTPPMYAAYSQSSKASEELSDQMETTEVPDFAEHLLNFVERMMCKNKEFLKNGDDDIDTSYWEQLKDVEEAKARRRQLVQDGEKWACDQIHDELADKQSVVDGLQRQVETLEISGRRMEKEIEAKKQENVNEERKREQAERRRKQRQMRVEGEKKKAESHGKKQVDKRQSVVDSLRLRISEAEACRRGLRSQITSKEREVTDAKGILHALSASLHDDRPKLKKSVEEWSLRVDELERMEEELRAMVEEALRTNAEAREQLSVVKPYQSEQLEMDALLEEEQRLDALLKETRRRQKAAECFPEFF